MKFWPIITFLGESLWLPSPHLQYVLDNNLQATMIWYTELARAVCYLHWFLSMWNPFPPSEAWVFHVPCAWDVVTFSPANRQVRTETRHADLGVLKAAAGVRRHPGLPWSTPGKAAKPWTVLCAGDARGRLFLLSEGLSTLASFDMDNLVPPSAPAASSAIYRVNFLL